MAEPEAIDAALSAGIVPVVQNLRAAGIGVQRESLMLVGARCRDILHYRSGLDFTPSATEDLDLALGIAEWGTFERIAAHFPRIGVTGVRFSIADCAVDILPFGTVEHPRGSVEPPHRGESMSVWAFREVQRHATSIDLGENVVVQMPTHAGYVALKAMAWLDRRERGEFKDANDLALAVRWHTDSDVVTDALWEQHSGLLETYGWEVDLAAAHLLGTEVTRTVGPERCAELLDRWPGNHDQLVANFQVVNAPAEWRSSPQRRQQLIRSFSAGLAD